MDKIKTLPFEWDLGQEEVALRVSSYANNGSLYIGLYNKTEEGFEPFGDLTVNLPSSDFYGRTNGAFIDHNFRKENLNFIEKNQLGTLLPIVGVSGFCKFARVAFDLERLKEFDREGVEQYLRQGPVRMEGTKKTKKREQIER